MPVNYSEQKDIAAGVDAGFHPSKEPAGAEIAPKRQNLRIVIPAQAGIQCAERSFPTVSSLYREPGTYVPLDICLRRNDDLEGDHDSYNTKAVKKLFRKQCVFAEMTIFESPDLLDSYLFLELRPSY